MYTSVVWPALGTTFTPSYSLCTTSLVLSTAFLKENEIVEATKMKKSLWNYESPEVAGEKKICSWSLKGVIDGILGTRAVNGLAPTQLPVAGTPLGNYTFKAIIPIGESDNYVACHLEPYPYVLFRCLLYDSRTTPNK